MLVPHADDGAGRAAPRADGTALPRDAGLFYCVPLVDFGSAILDFENHVLAVAGRRFFLSPRKMMFIGILLMSRGHAVAPPQLARALGIADGKYPQHVMARLAREIREQLGGLSDRLAIARGPKGYLIEDAHLSSAAVGGEGASNGL